jgi:hypothetical protein
MIRVAAASDLVWDGDRLRYPGRKPSVSVVPDATYPGMYRVLRPDGTLTDMVNRTRARDAAKSVLLGILNADRKGAEPGIIS